MDTNNLINITKVPFSSSSFNFSRHQNNELEINSEAYGPNHQKNLNMDNRDSKSHLNNKTISKIIDWLSWEP